MDTPPDRTRALPLLPEAQYRLIRDLASGELPLVDFQKLICFSGFSPSAGAEQVADYLLNRCRALGLANVSVERFASDGITYCGAYRSEPYWEASKGELWLVRPSVEQLADFRVIRTHLARNSRASYVTSELVNVGSGADPKEYEGRDVKGKLVLASGPTSRVMQLAVWERGALGVIAYRLQNAVDRPDQVGVIQLVPWTGPKGELPTFAFSLSYRAGETLRDRLAAGETLTLRAEVETTVGSGTYQEVRAEIPGTDPELSAVLLYAHNNSRNTGGANNLTGVGCTLEVARVLNHLIETASLSRPRRTIRFMWGPEHYGIHYHFRAYPEDLRNILAMINIDMIGYNQQTSGAVLHLYRSPYSNSSFVDDIAQAFLEKVGEENTVSIRHSGFLSTQPSMGFLDPIFAPTGSRSQLQYNVEPFWGPSDHEGANALGIKAIMLNDYPDVFLSTQDDSVAAVDPTQMRRGVVIAASAAYCMASATSENLPLLLTNATTKAQKRLIDDQTKALRYLDTAAGRDLPDKHEDAYNIINQGYLREMQSLNTLALLVGAECFQRWAPTFLEDIYLQHQMNEKRLKFTYNRSPSRESEADVQEERSADQSATLQFPMRTKSTHGPVNFFRLEYGRWWLVEKTADVNFDRHLALARRGDYMTYEALNLADGKRSVQQIRDVLSAEFEPVPLSEITQFFDFMASVGVIEIRYNE